MCGHGGLVNDNEPELGGFVTAAAVGAITGYMGGDGSNTEHGVSNSVTSLSKKITKQSYKKQTTYRKDQIANDIKALHNIFASEAAVGSASFSICNWISTAAGLMYDRMYSKKNKK